MEAWGSTHESKVSRMQVSVQEGGNTKCVETKVQGETTS